MYIKLTKAMIEADIVDYEKRISNAKNVLASLPIGYLEYKEHKKRDVKRRFFEAEIRHVQSLIRYAKEALAGLDA